MPRRAEYSDLVAQAEAAVAAVKDPELKRAAFEKVLDNLLGDRTGGSSARPATQPAPKRGSATRTKSGKAKGGPQAYVEELAADGFFKKPKTIAQVKAELENRGHHIPLTSLSGPLQKLCQRRTLRRQRAKTRGNKQTFNYSIW